MTADSLFTLKFDEAGNWKTVKTHRMSKELEGEQMTAFFTFFEFFETTGGLDPYLAYAKWKAHIRLRRKRRVRGCRGFFNSCC
jgi:hypothetical protein